MSIIDTAKSVANLAAEVNKMELRQQAVDLMGQVVEQQEQIRRLSEEAASLRDLLRLRESLFFEGNAYWTYVTEHNSQVRTGPFCSRCFDVLGKSVRMHKTNHRDTSDDPIYVCPECGKPNGQPPPPPARVGVVKMPENW